jgi:hypothetical protein
MTDEFQPWSASGAGGVPYFNAIQNDMYSNANGRLRFNGDKIGQMRFVFNLPYLEGFGILGPDVFHMRMTYTNAHRNSPSLVETVLKRVSSTSGNITNIATATSANGPQAGSDVVVNIKSPPFPKPDVATNYCYVVATLERKDPSERPTFIGVALIPGG